MSRNNNNASGGISFVGVLAIVFIVLKLTGTIAWSWWLVLAPLWAGVALVIAVLILVAPIALIVGRRKRRARRATVKSWR